MNHNVLILSAGRRVELVDSFKTEVKSFLPNAKVYAVDMKPNLSSACQIADECFQAPRVTDKSYPDFLKKLCFEKAIGLVIPTIDTELLPLAKIKDEFSKLGIHIIISNEELVAKCRNKNWTARLFESLDIDTPEIYNKDNVKFPCFVKPYDGSCSIGASALENSSMLTADMLENSKNMFMELIPRNYKEYTIDAYFDKSNKLVCAVPRLRIETRAGEISKGVTRKNHVYDYIIARLKELNGAVGCLTIQVFVDDEHIDYKAIEINPRFGGGYPLSYAAAANYPAMLIKEYLLNEKIDFYDQWQKDLLMLRYDAKVLVEDYVES